ncbi:MAG: hypothetical protein ACJ77T_02595 [Gemmatimonadaceae bacterium]
MSSRAFTASRPAVLSGLLLVVGSLLFMAGGRHHPLINANIGPLGSEQFYYAFATHVRMSPHWETFHNLILMGPVLWALGAAGLAQILPSRGAQVWTVARSAIAIGATAWIMAFALDGHNAPAFARAISDAADAAALREKLFEFSISSRLVAYLGRIGWTMITVSLATFAAGMLLAERATAWRKGVGAVGVLLGLWTIFEVVRGDFTPGPFTSQLWTASALSAGIWALAFGATIAATRAVSVVHPSRCRTMSGSIESGIDSARSRSPTLTSSLAQSDDAQSSTTRPSNR